MIPPAKVRYTKPRTVPAPIEPTKKDDPLRHLVVNENFGYDQLVLLRAGCEFSYADYPTTWWRVVGPQTVRTKAITGLDQHHGPARLLSGMDFSAKGVFRLRRGPWKVGDVIDYDELFDLPDGYGFKGSNQWTIDQQGMYATNNNGHRVALTNLRSQQTYRLTVVPDA